MSVIMTFEKLPCPVEIGSIKDIHTEVPPQLLKATLTCILTACGFATGCITEKTIELMKRGGYSSEVLAGVDCGYKIYALEEIWNKLLPDHRAAVLLHEAGHIVNGDVSPEITDANILKDGEEITGKLMVDQEKEFRADDYAANIVGKDVLRAAIIATVNAMGDFLNECHPGAGESFRAETLNSPMLVERLDRLAALD